LGRPHLGRDVDHTQQAESRVEGKAHHVRQTVGHLPLQKVVEADPGVFEVADEIAYPGAHEARKYKLIGLGRRLDDHFIELFIKTEHGAVVAFERDRRGCPSTHTLSARASQVQGQARACALRLTRKSEHSLLLFSNSVR
jgi:hypothetical protein